MISYIGLTHIDLSHNRICTKSIEAIFDSIESVINSYLDNNLANQVLVQPMIENVYGPIMGLMQVVRSGRSKLASEVKSAKNVLKFIAGLLQSKISAMDKSSNDVYGLMNIDCFFYNHVQHTYGLDALANKYCEIYLLSMDTHRKKDTRIELFLKFVGLDLDKLPYSIFEHYVTLIKATNISVTNLLNQPMHN